MQAILSVSEAACCIRDYTEGQKYSGEAVNHYGGVNQVINDAITKRHLWYLRKKNTVKERTVQL